MKKIRFSRKHLFPFILMVIPILFFLMKISGGYLAGSETDWLSQHIVFPEYFRQRFYETGNLFPDFAMEIGGGQNIYNFGYYGLYNPLYLLSYLLPFVDMAVYVQGMMLATWIADGLLCYLWLLREDFREEESFFASLIMIMAGPVVFHTSMQIMFVSYLPFLLLTLIGYDRYCRTGKYALLTLGVFCMVLTSFYLRWAGCRSSDLWTVRMEKGVGILPGSFDKIFVASVLSGVFWGSFVLFLSCPYLLCHAGRQERRQQRILEGAFPAGDRIGQDSIPSLRNGTYSGSGDRDRDKSVLPEKPGEIYGSVTYRSAAVSGF